MDAQVIWYKKTNDSVKFIFVCDIRDAPNGMQRVPLYPRSSAGPARTSYPPMRSHRNDFCVSMGGLGSQLIFFRSVNVPQSRPIPQQEALMEQDGAPHQ